MAATLPDAAGDGDLEALRRLAKAEPFEFLTADSDLAQTARGASRHLFSALAPLCPKSPFDRLLVDGFDAEQIWQQIDLQTQHLVPGLRRRLNQFKRSPDGIAKLLKSKNDGNLKVGDEGIDEFEEEARGDEEEGRLGGVEEVEKVEDEEEEEEEDEGEEEEGDGLRDVEDQFLKIKDQERYFEKREKEEFGEESGEDDADDGEDEEDEDEDEDDEDEFMDDIRYPFFDMKISVFDLVELVGNFCLNIKLDVVLGIWLYGAVINLYVHVIVDN